MISAKVIADSWNGITRLTTLEVKFHRFILPEVNTHRVFSRNTASSRAIPVAKMIEQVRNNPAVPVFWGKNQSGMSAYEEFPKCSDHPDSKPEVYYLWIDSMLDAVNGAEQLMDMGLHKQLTNRLIEPFMWTTMIISSTEWDNFFMLRRPPGGKMDPTFPAQPEMQVLAIEIYNAREASDPIHLGAGEWHVPYINDDDSGLSHYEKLMVSAARCARVSYLTHDGIRDIKKDLELADRLSRDKHMSPFEHQARSMGDGKFYANFKGFRQFRQAVERGLSVITSD